MKHFIGLLKIIHAKILLLYNEDIFCSFSRYGIISDLDFVNHIDKILS